MVLFALLLPSTHGQAGLGGAANVRIEAVGAPRTRTFWGPDGRPASGPFVKYARLVAGMASPHTDPHLRWVLVSVSGTRSAPSVLGRFANGPIRPSTISWNAGRAWACEIEGNTRVNPASIQIGLASGAWKRIGTVRRLAGDKVSRTGVGFFRSMRPEVDAKASAGYRNQVIASVVFPADIANHAYRVTATDRHGKEMPLLRISSSGASAGREAWFGGQYADVVRLDLQTRPVRWQSFPNVHLSPRK